MSVPIVTDELWELIRPLRPTTARRRRLRLRWERRADLHEALLALACCLICYRCLQR